MGAGWSVPSYLLTGAGLFGGLGWLVDGWLGTSFLVAVGVVVGLGLALYVIWIRYVSPPAGGSQGRPSGRGPMSRHGGGDPEEAL